MYGRRDKASLLILRRSAQGVTAFPLTWGLIWWLIMNAQKSGQKAFHPKSPFPAYSSAPGRPEWGACSGPWRSHRIPKQMTNWHMSLCAATDGRGFRTVLTAWSLSLWVPACPCPISVTSSCPADSRWPSYPKPHAHLQGATPQAFWELLERACAFLTLMPHFRSVFPQSFYT